jgi:hypothetical protein
MVKGYCVNYELGDGSNVYNYFKKDETKVFRSFLMKLRKNGLGDKVKVSFGEFPEGFYRRKQIVIK